MFKKLLITLGIGLLSLSGFSKGPGPYHENVGNGEWTIIERIRSVKAIKFADGTTQSTASTTSSQLSDSTQYALDSINNTKTLLDNSISDSTQYVINYTDLSRLRLPRIITVSDTLELTDQYKNVVINIASANNLTIPIDSIVSFPIGTIINILSIGAGQTTVVPIAGVTVNSEGGALKIRAQYAGVSLWKRDTNIWWLVGAIVN
jgi:hypothetical protein